MRHSIAAALIACQSSETCDWQRAQAIFDGYKPAATSAMCYSALLDVLADSQQWTLLLRYFDQQKRGGVRPSPRAYERAIEACDRVDPDRSVLLFAELRASG